MAAGALFGSTDCTELTCREDLRDALAGSLDLDIEGIRARIRLILLYGHAPLSADRAGALLVRLGLILPALRTGFGMHLRLGQRLTNAEIASALGISSHTARHHTESVLIKVGVHTRRALRRVLTSDW